MREGMFLDKNKIGIGDKKREFWARRCSYCMITLGQNAAARAHLNVPAIMSPPFSLDKYPSLVSRRASSMFPNLRRLEVPNTTSLHSSVTQYTQGASSSSAINPVRRTTSAESSNQPPSELLNLKLTGPSFLDTIVRDTVAKKPLYLIETVSECTNIYRLGPIHDHAIKAATLQWPHSVLKMKGRSGVSVQMGAGIWRDAEDILKTGTLSNSQYVSFSFAH